MKNQRHLYGQINFDELLKGVKSGKVNTNIITRKDGSTFRAVDINLWFNEEKKFGQDASISLSNKMEFKDGEKYYIANLKYSESKTVEASPDDFADEIDGTFP